MSTYLQPTFWLSLDPVSITQGAGRVLLFLFVAMVCSGVAARVRARKSADRFEKAIWRRVARLLLTMGFVGLIMGFFGYEHIRFLGARFWYVAWLLVSAGWTYFVVRFVRGKVPSARALHRQREMRDKYLPEADPRR